MFLEWLCAKAVDPTNKKEVSYSLSQWMQLGAAFRCFDRYAKKSITCPFLSRLSLFQLSDEPINQGLSIFRMWIDPSLSADETNCNTPENNFRQSHIEVVLNVTVICACSLISDKCMLLAVSSF